MKLYSVLLSISLVAVLNAGETSIEKYTQLRNESNILKIEEYRNLLLQQRNVNQELRDKRLKALYARMENNKTPYR